MLIWNNSFGLRKLQITKMVKHVSAEPVCCVTNHEQFEHRCASLSYSQPVLSAHLDRSVEPKMSIISGIFHRVIVI